jgi:peptidyl-prolyl cis-trans isomerase D
MVAQTISDADLHVAYEKAKNRVLVPEKRHARHILITGKDDAAARAQAEQVLAQVKAGKDFGALAKQYSQDPGSAQNGGDLGWAERTSFVAPFADALFGMAAGEVKGPVKTQYGYHIIRLDEIQAGKGKSFEEARADLEAQLRRDRATDRFGEIQEQLQTKVAEPGADLSVLAQEYHLTHGDIAEFQKGAGGAPLGPAPQLQEVLFADPPLAAGRIAGPIVLGDDRLVVAKVVQQRAAQPKPLTEVREAIVAALTKEQASQAALKAAEAARAKLQSGTPFEALLQELRASADPAHYIAGATPGTGAGARGRVRHAGARGQAGLPRARAQRRRRRRGRGHRGAYGKRARSEGAGGSRRAGSAESGSERGNGLRRGSAPYRRRAQESQGLRIARRAWGAARRHPLQPSASSGKVMPTVLKPEST